MPPVDFADVRSALDNNKNFEDVANSGWHGDAVYEQFSDAEYQRRYEAVYAKMDELGLDALIVGGGPNHWSYGGGVLWLTGHFEWHGIACYLLVPRNGEPTLVYSMGGTHIESVRNQVWASDVRPSRMGAFGEVLAEVAQEKGLASARIGHPPIDPRFRDYMPVNQHAAIVGALPDAQFTLIDDIFHDLLRVKSAEELDCVRVAGLLCADAFAAMAEAARPGATEEDLPIFVDEPGAVSPPVLRRGHAARLPRDGETDQGLEPGQVLTLEPNPIRPDGNLGMFLGHSYIVTATGNEMVTKGPLEMVVTG